jgi:hypothetical protein
MGYELGGTGWLGVAVETAYGTWVTPTKWIPIRSESLQKVEDKIYRTNIRGLADRSGAIQGYTHIEGDVEFEVSADILTYFLYASRVTPSSTGAGPYAYTFVPAHVASPSTAAGKTSRKSLSVTIMRDQRGFGYFGVSVTRMSFRVENGLLMCTATLMGLDEAQQAGPFTPVWTQIPPFGPLYNAIEIPNASVRTDIDGFTLDIDDGGEAQNRIKTTGGRAPSFIKWGEREVTVTADIDFDTLTDYNAFLAQTKQVLKFTSTENATTNKVTITLNATVIDSYQVNLSGLGDLVRASTAFHGIYDTSDVYTIVVNSAENIA